MFAKFKDLFSALVGRTGYERLDRGLMKTMMMLAAVDGDVSADEISRFKAAATGARGYDEASFAALWEDALRASGYVLLQSRLLSRDELVRLFVAEADRDLVNDLALEPTAERTRAFNALEKMAAADGDYSDGERACVAALVERVRQAREAALAERYPRAAAFGR